MPEFPKEFVLNHCPKVIEARDWRRIYKVEGTNEDDVQFAECEFKRAGVGMACQNCNIHLTRPFLNHELDRKFLPLIEQYYHELDEAEATKQISIVHAAEELNKLYGPAIDNNVSCIAHDYNNILFIYIKKRTKNPKFPNEYKGYKVVTETIGIIKPI